MPRNVCHSQFYHQRYDETCVSTRFEITLRVIFTPEYSLVQLLKAAECLSAFMCTEEEIRHVKSYLQLSVHKSASHYENRHMATHNLSVDKTATTKKATCRKKKKSQENFKVLRINPAEASKVKSALIKFHVQRLSRF